MKRLATSWRCLALAGLASAFTQAQTFENADIGSPALPGSTLAAGSQTTVTGAGADIWGTCDQFQFHWTQVTGDFDVTVRVESLEGTHQWAKAELMVRSPRELGGAPECGDAFYAAMATREAGQNVIGPQWRAARDASAASDGTLNVPTQYPDNYLRLVRKGSLLEAYYSFDGTSWEYQHEVDTAIDDGWEEFPATVSVGLAVTSHDATSTATAVFQDLAFEPTGAPVIAEQPANATVAEGGSASFTVAAEGTPGTYQWTKDGEDIPGATAWTYSLANVSLADNGAQFAVRIANDQGSVASNPAELTVQADTTPPELVTARGSGNPHGIVVTFNEAMDPVSSTTTENYKLSGQEIAVEAVSMLSENEVLLSVGEFTPDPMTLTVNDVKDASAGGNVIGADSQADIVAQGTLAAYWPLDEGAGTTTVETVAGNDGTLAGATLWSADTPDLGRPNPHAVDFDGVDSLIRTPYPGVAGTQQRTVAFWINSFDTADSAAVGWGDSTRNQTKYHVRINPATGTIRTEVQGGNNWATTVINDGLWHHVVSVVPDLEAPNNDDILHYVDGALDPRLGGGSQAVNTDISAPSSQNVWIGARDQAGSMQYYTGLIDEVAIFQLALSEEEIADLARGVDPRTLAAPLGAPLSIDAQPTDVAVAEGESATFESSASGSPILGYQWLRNDEAIPGANAPTYTIPVASSTDNGAEFRVEVFNADGTYGRLASDTVTLQVDTDLQPPRIASLRGVGDGLNLVYLLYDEPVDPVTGGDAGNYEIEGVDVTAAMLDASGFAVTLETGALDNDATYQLTVTGVKDLSASGNELHATVEFPTYVAYPDELRLDDPDFYFSLSELSGTEALDSIGKDPGFIGTYTTVGGTAPPTLGEDRLVAGAPNLAVRFAAAESTLIAFNTDSTLINQGGPYRAKTIELWFKANSLPAFPGDATLPEKMCLFEQGGTTRGISIYLSGTQDSDNPTEAELYFHAWNDNSDGAASPWGGPEEEGKFPVFVKGTVRVGEVYHAALVMDGDETDAVGRLDGYLNGDKLPDHPFGDNLLVGLLYNHGDNAGLGGVNQNAVYHDQNRGIANGDYFDGTIDEFSTYSAALSEERIQAHYNRGLTEVPILETPEQPEQIRITNIASDGASVTIEWEGGGSLQSASGIGEAFVTIPGSSSPHTEAVEAGMKIYRVILLP